MAKRRVRQKPRPKSGARPTLRLRAEAVGSVLVVLAFLTLLSLLSPNRGNLTDALIGGLQIVFGIGVWGMPILFAALGFWLVLRQVTEESPLPGSRLAGGIALFLVFESGAHLVAAAPDPMALAMAGGGGGVIGWSISQTLISMLGMEAAVGMLVLVGAVSLFVLAGIGLQDLQNGGRALWQRLRNGRRPPDDLLINPTLPLERHEPAWQRWWQRLAHFWSRPQALPAFPPPEKRPTPVVQASAGSPARRAGGNGARLESPPQRAGACRDGG